MNITFIPGSGPAVVPKAAESWTSTGTPQGKSSALAHSHNAYQMQLSQVFQQGTASLV